MSWGLLADRSVFLSNEEPLDGSRTGLDTGKAGAGNLQPHPPGRGEGGAQWIIFTAIKATQNLLKNGVCAAAVLATETP